MLPLPSHPVAAMPAPSPSSETLVRRLMRYAETAVLTTVGGPAHAGDGWPYGALVLVATGADGAPLLLLSDLAGTPSFAVDGRAALVFDGTRDHADPLTGPRATVLGELTHSDDPALNQRFLRATQAPRFTPISPISTFTA